MEHHLDHFCYELTVIMKRLEVLESTLHPEHKNKFLVHDAVLSLTVSNFFNKTVGVFLDILFQTTDYI